MLPDVDAQQRCMGCDYDSRCEFVGGERRRLAVREGGEDVISYTEPSRQSVKDVLSKGSWFGVVTISIFPVRSLYPTQPHPEPWMEAVAAFTWAFKAIGKLHRES